MEKRLVRSTKNEVIAGVCGGIGEYFEVDPTIIRIIFVILAVWGGVGIILYLIALIVMPKEGEKMDKEKKADVGEKISKAVDEATEKIRTHDHGRDNGGYVFGLIILLLGVLFLLHNFIPAFNAGQLWPIILIIIGLLILIKRK